MNLVYILIGSVLSLGIILLVFSIFFVLSKFINLVELLNGGVLIFTPLFAIFVVDIQNINLSGDIFDNAKLFLVDLNVIASIISVLFGLIILFNGYLKKLEQKKT